MNLKDIWHEVVRVHVEVDKPGVCSVWACVPVWGTERYRAQHTISYVIAEGWMHHFVGDEQLRGLAGVQTQGELQAWLREIGHTCERCLPYGKTAVSR